MKYYILKEPELREIIAQAHMAGQNNQAGVDPSYSEAIAHWTKQAKKQADFYTVEHYFTTKPQQDQEERSCFNCKHGVSEMCQESENDYCINWEPKQSQSEQKIDWSKRNCNNCGEKTSGSCNGCGADICPKWTEQKPSAEWEPIKVDAYCDENPMETYQDAINNNAEGIKLAHEDNHMQWIRINSDYDELFNEVASLHTQLSALKERFDKAEIRYCKQWEMISSINDKIDQREDDKK